MKILQITLKEKIDDFIMSKGETLEFFNGGFKSKDIDQPFYPNFGPYIQLNEIAERMITGKGTPEMHRLFDTQMKIIKENG